MPLSDYILRIDFSSRPHLFKGNFGLARPTPIMTTGVAADPAERLASAQKLREEGNAKFKEKDMARRSISSSANLQ